MPKSLRCMLKSLQNKGYMDKDACDKILKKLDGHDRELKAEWYFRGVMRDAENLEEKPNEQR